MRYEIRPLSPKDLAALELQAAQFASEMWQPREILPLIVRPNEAWTLLADGRPLAAAGILYGTPTRGRVWALFGRHMTARAWGEASLKMGARLTALQDPEQGGTLERIEAECRLDFIGGHRLLAHLGFRYETHLPGAGPDGCTLALYARLRHRPVAALNRLEALRVLAYRTMIDDLMPPALREKAA